MLPIANLNYVTKPLQNQIKYLSIKMRFYSAISSIFSEICPNQINILKLILLQSMSG